MTGDTYAEHARFMAQALSVSLEDPGEVPVGAVVVCGGEVIASAHNQREGEDGEPFGHAEMLAMRRAAEKFGARRLKDCTLYVTLEPCPMCAGAMILAQLGACVFGAFDPVQGCCGSVYDLPQDSAFPHRVRVVGGVMREEAQKQLRAFFEGRRKGPRPEGQEPEESLRDL